MPPPEQIREDDILIRRIPPDTDHMKSIIDLPDGRGRRPTSGRLKPRPGEDGTSCSILRLTSPTRLLELGALPLRCEVCYFAVRDVRELGFELLHLPEEDDPGHCEFCIPEGVRLGKKAYSKLSHRARMLTRKELETGEVNLP